MAIGSHIVAKAMKNEGVSDFFYIMGAPMMAVETAAMKLGMRGIDVRGEYDFINDDTLTENEEGDLYGQDSHGTVTFSALAGFRQGELIGPAFNAAFYLAKTEVNGSETQVEEGDSFELVHFVGGG